MALSASVVFHLTRSKDSLYSILSDQGFRPKYCSERLEFREQSSGQLKSFEGAYPMVSFCDIPLSELKEHIGKYGDYGIGLSKNWAEEAGLNPVLYFAATSQLAGDLTNLLTSLSESKKSASSEHAVFEKYTKQLARILAYAKNYEGAVPQRDLNLVRFADEQEWRFVPSNHQLSEVEAPFVLGKKKIASKDNFNSLVREFILPFKPNDIRYILIKDESEIGDLTNKLNNLFRTGLDSESLDILTSRILTTEQIKQDF